MNGPAGLIKRLEEAQPLRVVVMPVRDEQVAHPIVWEVIAELINAAACVENEQFAVIKARLNARGVGSVKLGCRRVGGYASQYTPKNNLHGVLPVQAGSCS